MCLHLQGEDTRLQDLGDREVKSVNWAHLANVSDEMLTSNTGL